MFQHEGSLPQVIMTNQVFLAGELQLQIRFVPRIEILKEFFSMKAIMSLWRAEVRFFYQMTLSIREYLSTYS